MPDGAYRRSGPEVKERALAMYAEGGSLSAISRVLGYSAPGCVGMGEKGVHGTEPVAGAQ